MTRDEADDALRRAIADHAVAYEMAAPDEMLDEFAVVAHWQRIEADGRSSYTLHFTRETVPSYVATGLFQTALDLVHPYEDE